ncbi:hypothetical protein [Algoriphagus sediminis]|uniref:PNPLA domain-containing protein n=1 Tax=Algoriphagus sediminis TaxID=3057113 RepID=A0ABT7Y8Y4_9BACT|nr:hypothetical protein [Algoriphagus sediminis]MDN3202977.1 hypothetical protein [Algoriphagus sediminis]
MSDIFFDSAGESDSKKVLAKIWTDVQETGVFPENSLDLPSTGVCFCGGGTRAMNCAIGQMKGFYELNLWKDIGYISAVSGGSWASTIFTYYQDGSISDADLLGNKVCPSNLCKDNLNDQPEGFMGKVVSHSLEKNLILRLGKEVIPFEEWQKLDNIWIDAVGDTYLKPYGIYDSKNPKFFTLDDETRDAIIARNPQLQASDFIMVHSNPKDAKRPYLIINSSLQAPAPDLPIQKEENLTVFNYTPLYVGSACYREIEDKNLISNKDVKFGSGGGFIESFAFGGSNPKKTSMNDSLSVILSKKPFEIVDATGTSSTAYGATLGSFMLSGLAGDLLDKIPLSKFIPEDYYWPYPELGKIGKPQPYRFTDGGNLENLGVITLLQRKVERIVVFINTDTPLATGCSFDAENPPNNKQVSSDFYPLFGFTWGNQVHNQVFHKRDFNPVYQKLAKAKEEGKTVMARTKLMTIANDWWGIPDRQKVEILWVYNDRVPDWENQLCDDLKNEISKGEKGRFRDFPHYKLLFENGVLHGISLTTDQVNLLYQLSAWNIYSNEHVFRDFLE